MEIVKLYKENGEEFNTEGYRLIASGSRSNIYENAGKVLKVYNGMTSVGVAIDEKMFNELKKIDSGALPKLGECLYHGKKKKFFSFVRAYTSEKIDKDYTDILTMDPHKFAVDVAGKLGYLSDDLANNRIVMNSPKSGNIIVNRKGAYIVDPDLFEKSTRLSREECSIKNKIISLKYMKMMVRDCAMHRHALGDRDAQINQIFDVDVNHKTDLTIEIYHKLRDDTLLKVLRK